MPVPIAVPPIARKCLLPRMIFNSIRKLAAVRASH
jgi:hypothetical protein